MYIKKTFLICDDCSKTFGVDDRIQNYSAKELRDKAKNYGWIVKIDRTPKKLRDLCPDCKKATE